MKKHVIITGAAGSGKTTFAENNLKGFVIYDGVSLNDVKRISKLIKNRYCFITNEPISGLDFATIFKNFIHISL